MQFKDRSENWKPTVPGDGIVLATAGVGVVLDVNDIDRQAAFWSAVLGEEPGPLRSGGGWITVGSLDSKTHLVLQRVPEPKVVKDQCHMCFVVPDVDEAVRQVVALGGGLWAEPDSPCCLMMEFRPARATVVEEPNVLRS